jgi:drug/metabolite transporter (DMT)-like permease
MGYVLICILIGATVPQLLRFSQRGHHSPSAIAMLAYGFGAVYTLVVVIFRDGAWAPLSHPAVLGWGVLAGLSGFSGVLLGMACFKRAGVGVSTAIGSLSVVLATLAAWLMWHDPIDAIKWIGLTIMPFAFVLLRPAGKGSVRQTRVTITLLAAVCLTGAVTNTAHKSASEMGPQGYELAYQLIGFTMAAAVGFVHLLWQRRLPGRIDFGVGSAVGVCFAASQLSMMHALNDLPATLIYPTLGTAGVALNVIIARRLWRERMLCRQIVGVTVAIVVVLLMNIRW